MWSDYTNDELWGAVDGRLYHVEPIPTDLAVELETRGFLVPHELDVVRGRVTKHYPEPHS